MVAEVGMEGDMVISHRFGYEYGYGYGGGYQPQV